MPRVTAIIPHWNRRDLLGPLLENLRAQARPFDEILVADNGSTDGSAELAERAGARVLRLGNNLGFAAAVNRGIGETAGDWVAILNNDVTLESGWLRYLLEAAVEQEAWFATGKILNARDPSLIDGAFDEISRGACASRCGSGKPDGPVWNQPRRIRMAPMTAAIFRRDLFQELGGLDESFGSYLEDVDFGLRCALAEKSGVYVPSAVARHWGSATWGEWRPETIFRLARNQVLLAAKYFQPLPRVPVMVGQWLWGMLALRHGHPLAFLKGRRAGFQAAGGVKDEYSSKQAATQLAHIVQASEDEIFALAQQTGFDTYWRVYFWLLRR